MTGTEPWFEPKAFGYGAGLPCAWQGWVLLVAYLASVIFIAMSAQRIGLVVSMAAILALTIPFLWLAKRHTRGGWRWRG
ncbi:hypothetical protein D6201_08685 [Aurantiacibacter aquimixticola]|uniref:Uncharacterized protein n=1 Tax=Aurantiacibacter aquimixticola TaxID=1958945 RepID=A0A419RX21_9SPHN|nr:hypothetical protein D6201_08685 [Aurantiacibacter aquimixticola]